VTRKRRVNASGGASEILADIAFSLGAGEIGALIGPSGCGKTTLLRIIAGLDAQFEGAIQRPPGRIAMVFQEPRLLPWRSVEANIALAAPGLGREALDRLLVAFGLDNHRSHFPGELSLGLARRVAIARAFAIPSSLLLLDEPFASLDGTLALTVQHELMALIDRRPVTTLLVTHQLDEAIRLADRIWILSSGPARIVDEIEIATPRQARTEAERIRIMVGIESRSSDGGRR
jgi:ABC-type nitrate/sulfonate/bicarbonate transport system ATPase subunit